MDETLKKYLTIIKDKITIFANSNMLEYDFSYEDFDEKDYPKDFLFLDFNSKLNIIQKEQLDSILTNWRYDKGNVISSNFIHIHYRYIYSHKNLLAKIRSIELKKLVD